MSIDALEQLLTSLGHWLVFWTLLAVAGLIVEYVPEIIGLIQTKPFPWRSVNVIIGGILITAGVAGELYIEGRTARFENDLRNANDTAVANLNKQAAEATQSAETERLARIMLEAQIAPRRLTGAQKAELTRQLKQYSDPVGIVVISALLDPESSDFADDFDTAIKQANWKTLRLKDRLTQKVGVSLGLYEGTPVLDPYSRPILGLKQRVGNALKAIGIQYNDVTFGKDEQHSTGTPFEPGPIYLSY